MPLTASDAIIREGLGITIDSLRELTVASIERFLHRVPGSRLVQFTYLPRAPFEASPDFQWQRADWVWRNAPPAGVWVLQRRS